MVVVQGGTVTLAPEGAALHELELARRAGGGDGEAFAALYDRYESRVFNFCHRLLGSPDDAADATQDAFVKVLGRLPALRERELKFAAYLFTAARNASYDAIARRGRAQPVDELPETPGAGRDRERGDAFRDPEGAALLAGLQDDVRRANATLPARQREVLALRELEELSYDEIAQIMDMNRNSVAQLISRARLSLRAALRAQAMAAISGAAADCERALPLIAAREDDQGLGAADRRWLERHLVGCATCPARIEAMAEAGASYRAWAPIVPLVWLRDATIAQAATRVGADWSHLLTDGGGRRGASQAIAGTGAGASAWLPAGGADAATAAGRPRARARRWATLGATVALVLALGASIASSGAAPDAAGGNQPAERPAEPAGGWPPPSLGGAWPRGEPVSDTAQESSHDEPDRTEAGDDPATPVDLEPSPPAGGQGSPSSSDGAGAGSPDGTRAAPERPDPPDTKPPDPEPRTPTAATPPPPAPAPAPAPRPQDDEPQGGGDGDDDSGGHRDRERSGDDRDSNSGGASDGNGGSDGRRRPGGR